MTVRPADVVVVNSGTIAGKKLDAHALGLPSTLNIVAIDTMGTHTDLLAAFDTAAGSAASTSHAMTFCNWTFRVAYGRSAICWMAFPIGGAQRM
ncbi:MAG: hypothetical protein WBV39_12275 [Rudaea sp.]